MFSKRLSGFWFVDLSPLPISGSAERFVMQAAKGVKIVPSWRCCVSLLSVQIIIFLMKMDFGLEQLAANLLSNFPKIAENLILFTSILRIRCLFL